MTTGKKQLFGIICPILLFLFIMASDLGLFHIPFSSLPQVPVRELIFGLVIVVFLWGTSSVEWFKTRTLPQKLRFFGIGMILLWISKKCLSVELHVFQRADKLDEFLKLVLFFGIFLLSVWIWNTLKELIYIRRGKRTQNHFRLLLFLVILAMLNAIVNFDGFVMPPGDSPEVPYTILGAVLLGLVIFMAFINGFRCKWIHYLNKRKKVGFFFFFLVVNFFATNLLFSSMEVVNAFSVLFGMFYWYLIIICAVYSGMALLGILVLLPSAGILDRRLREIQSLQTLSASLGSVFEKEELVTVTTELARKIVHADYTWIELKEQAGFELAAVCNIREEDVKKISDDVIKMVRREVREVETSLLINDLPKNQSTREIRHWKRKAGSLLVSPIRFKKKDLGLLYAMTGETFGFAEENRTLFRAFADQVALALENSHLIQVTIDQEVYREELRVAHEAQMRILPQQMPVIKGVELDAFCMTANEIGGDFYDLIEVNDDRLDIVIGDVSGKGPNAAFYMAELKGVIQALAPLFSSPKQILLEMNKFAVNHFEADTFATMVYGIFLLKKRQLQMVRAGHPPVGLIRKKTVTWLETEGVGIGLASNTVFSKTLKKKIIQLQKGDVVFFHTDGLMEARDNQGEEFGEALLTETLVQAGDKNAAEVLSEVKQSMEQFTKGVPRHDDVTLVALGLV